MNRDCFCAAREDRWNGTKGAGRRRKQRMEAGNVAADDDKKDFVVEHDKESITLYEILTDQI